LTKFFSYFTTPISRDLCLMQREPHCERANIPLEKAIAKYWIVEKLCFAQKRCSEIKNGNFGFDRTLRTTLRDRKQNHFT